MTYKKCNKCDQSKTLDGFNKDKRRVDGRTTICKDCRNYSTRKFKNRAYSNIIDREGRIICTRCNVYKAKEYFYNTPNGKLRMGKMSNCIECTRIRLSTLEGHITRIVSSSKRSAKKKKLDFDINTSFIINMYNEQEGRCKISNILMTHKFSEKVGRHIKDYYKISIDRIDSNKGYTKDNVRLVCAQINMMMGTMEDKEFHNIIQNIHDNKKYNK